MSPLNENVKKQKDTEDTLLGEDIYGDPSTDPNDVIPPSNRASSSASPHVLSSAESRNSSPDLPNAYKMEDVLASLPSPEDKADVKLEEDIVSHDESSDVKEEAEDSSELEAEASEDSRSISTSRRATTSTSPQPLRGPASLSRVPFPTEAETERYLRTNMHSTFPDDKPVNLRTLSESTTRPTIDALIIAAIWGSPNRRLTVREIYDAVREHFPQLDKGNRKWRNGIKYQLSLKAKYVRQRRPDHEPGPGYGQHWLININMGEGYTRKRDRKDAGFSEADESVFEHGEDVGEEGEEEEDEGLQGPWTTYDPYDYYDSPPSSLPGSSTTATRTARSHTQPDVHHRDPFLNPLSSGYPGERVMRWDTQRVYSTASSSPAADMSGTRSLAPERSSQARTWIPGANLSPKDEEVSEEGSTELGAEDST